MSKITNDGLTRSCTGCFIAYMATVGVKGLTTKAKGQCCNCDWFVVFTKWGNKYYIFLGTSYFYTRTWQRSNFTFCLMLFRLHFRSILLRKRVIVKLSDS